MLYRKVVDELVRTMGWESEFCFWHFIISLAPILWVLIWLNWDDSVVVQVWIASLKWVPRLAGYLFTGLTSVSAGLFDMTDKPSVLLNLLGATIHCWRMMAVFMVPALYSLS